MENSVKFEDRIRLYESIIDDLNLKLLEEHYSAHTFGNYFVIFSAKEFLIRYDSDRSELTISVASNSAPSKWFPLLFIKNFINNTNKLSQPIGFNLESINHLNDFLKNNFSKIAELLSDQNYKNTFSQIGTLLKNEFINEHPGAVESS